MEIRDMIEDIVKSDEKMKSVAELGIRSMLNNIRKTLQDEMYNENDRSVARCVLEYPANTPMVVLRYIRQTLWKNWRIKADLLRPTPRNLNYQLQVDIFDDLYNDGNDIF